MSTRAIIAASLVVVGFTIATRAQTPAPRWKNLQVLTDMQSKPEIELYDVMDFMAGSLSVSCDYCHSGAFENDARPAKATARKMIKMMRSINDANFGGRPVISCQTCHQGHARPVNVPAPWFKTPQEIEAYSAAIKSPPATSASTPAPPPRTSPALPAVDTVLANYRKAVGVTTAKTMRMVGKLTAANWGGPFEFLIMFPDQVRYTVQAPGGESTQILNRDHGWAVTPASRNPLDPAFLGRIRIEWREKLFLPPALTPADITVTGIEPVGGRDCYVLAFRSSRGLERWYFDTQSSLLVKLHRETPTPFGASIKESEFLEYRASGGVVRPFTIRDHYMSNEFDYTFTDIQVDVAIDPAIFEPPAPKERASIAL